ncbi:MAG: lipopolysaccharide heptosyltransferase I [Gammaproteobacteria bacterium]|nr:lipopolysaccharide heptosyltransferase I [Gammaproteobacteria bacterium]
MRLLIVKTSSLGDVVHALPALSDAAAAQPGLIADWLVEQTFAEVPGWHPAVARVIRCDLRGWRRHPWRALRGGDWVSFTGELRAQPYDLIVDAQGLVKSAWLARRARGPLAGPDRRSAREPLASLFYDHRYAVPRHDRTHAVERARRLLAQALGYALPATPPDAGLNRAGFPAPPAPGPYALLLHGSSWPNKRWPPQRWAELGRWLRRQGLTPAVPWGSSAEREDAQAITAACDGLLLPRCDLSTLAGWLAHARCFVGVDTGLAHLGAALGVPAVTLYGPTLPQLTGTLGAHQLHLADAAARRIDRRRPLAIEVERVTAAVETLLRGGGQ